MPGRFLFHLLILFFVSPVVVSAQQVSRVIQEQCATMQRLQVQFERNPDLRKKFEQETARFTNAVKRGAYRELDSDTNATSKTTYIIPVVFHIVSTNPDNITDATIQAQMDVLNKDFAGINEDTTRVPAYFKPLFGRSAIQFCLAQQTPSGEGTSGIERIKTTKTSFVAGSDAERRISTGGVGSWDTKRYYNVWVCNLSSSVLGYSTLPNDAGASDLQGSTIDTRSLPGGSLTNYNSGKTLTHETGHFFNLLHIWGDDGGDCTGSDLVDDTPNQADASKNCASGIKTDACTTGGNGIMYQNYMDYSFDSCLVMFTRQQVVRMESALLAYRSSLTTSNGCTQPVLKKFDARLASIDQPSQRLCSSSFTPVVSFENRGSQILTSLDINMRIDSGSIKTYNWKGSLAYLAKVTIPLTNITTDTGIHTLTIYVTNPNNNADENIINDTISARVQFYNAVASVSEGFEANTFPPTGWDIVNPDNFITWKRVNGISKSGSSSVMIENFNYNTVGQKDDLLMPTVTLQKIDTAFLSFQVAAATYSGVSGNSSAWDTLEVLVSTDCGLTYTSIYKKFGRDLVTRTAPTTSTFIPGTTEWRKDSINLVNYLGKDNLLIAFRNTTGYENNVYLDDVNLRTVVVNPNLKRRGFMVTPNPTNGIIAVQFYPQPSDLRALQVYNIAGQKLLEITVEPGQENNYYQFNLSKYAPGTYVVRAVFTDRVVTTKILKF